MTREEAKDFLTKISYALGNMSVEYLTEKDGERMREAIEALEQEPILDKIRAEIDIARFIDKDTKLCKNANASGLEVAMQIIDKYKAERSEE